MDGDGRGGEGGGVFGVLGGGGAGGGDGGGGGGDGGGAGGERPQREAESPQQEGRALLRGPDTRNRTSNPDSWVLPGRTTIGGEVHSHRARPRHPIGRRGKLRPSGQPREGSQTAA